VLRLRLPIALSVLLAALALASPASADRRSDGAWQPDPGAWNPDYDVAPDPAPSEDDGSFVPTDDPPPPAVEVVGPVDLEQPVEPSVPAVPVVPAAAVVPVAPLKPLIPVPTARTIPGRVALLRADGKAAVPRGAPKRIRNLIAAANQIVGKPYRWGGGHARLLDRGYDCSGAVSYALIAAGLLSSPAVSGGLAHWGVKGPSRWLNVFANSGHVYLEVAGLRLDTSAVGDPGGSSGVRWRPLIGRRVGFHPRRAPGV